MHISFFAEFITDGDFNFRQDNLNALFNTSSPLYNNANIEYDYVVDGETITIMFFAEGNENNCRWALRDLLEACMCSIDTHKHYLVKKLYDLFEYFHQHIWSDEDDIMTQELSGNYDGTIAQLLIEH